MMDRSGSFRFARAEGFSALEIPYKGVGMSMLFVLPDAVDGLEALERSFGAVGAEHAQAFLGEDFFERGDVTWLVVDHQNRNVGQRRGILFAHKTIRQRR